MATKKTEPDTINSTSVSFPDEGGWDTAVSLGTTVELEVGEVFIGDFNGYRTIEYVNPKSGEPDPFKVYELFGADGELYIFKSSFVVDQGFEVIAQVAMAPENQGRIIRVRIERRADVPVNGQPSPMKDYKIQFKLL